MERAKRGVQRGERDDDGGGADVLQHFGGNGDGQLRYNPDNRGGQPNASVPSVRLKWSEGGSAAKGHFGGMSAACFGRSIACCTVHAGA
eukprot:g12894.t1